MSQGPDRIGDASPPVPEASVPDATIPQAKGAAAAPAEPVPIEAAAAAAAGSAPLPTPGARGSRKRLIAIAVALLLIFVVAYALGLDEWLDRERIRAAVEAAGPWGFVIFTALFSVGELAHVPGWVFIGVATLLWGSLLGGIVSYVAGLVSISFAFLLVRRAGGQALTSIERPWMKKALLRLETRPILTVVVLRLFLFMTPAVNYALALTPLRFRDFLLGSAIGLIPGVILFASGAAAIFGWG